MKERPAPSLIGRELGTYRILSLLGVGGMGEVYLARDSRLGREVAIKVLPRDLASDPERRARFEREARLLAALNHPHIATLYGFEEEGGVAALVLERVEGPTLAERLAAGPLPMREALSSARQIADALEAAHEKGIVHRDLKPGNIKMTAAGTVKVLDFGLAKATTQGASHLDLSQTPTRGGEETREGIILGTPGYMSPEQARGLAASNRTDLWAFGCILYEMLTGRRAFSGETVSDTLAAVLQSAPDWALLPGSTPAIVRRLLRRCLVKDPKNRLRDAGDALLDLDEALEPGGADPEARRISRGGWPWPAALVGILLLGVIGTFAWIRWRGVGSQPVTRATVTLPANLELDSEDGAAPLALSADGRRIVYAARSEGRAQLYLRSLDDFEARPVAGTENARYPFFSPDGRWVGFFADGKLKRVAVDGGAPMPIGDAPSSGRGASWGPDGTIVFDDDAVGLVRIASEGGRAEPLTLSYGAIDPSDLDWPQYLPDGRAILVTLRSRRPARKQPTLALVSPETGALSLLGPGSQAQYLPGYLVFHAPHIREGQLHAAAFDSERLSLRNAPVAVLDDVFRARNAGGAYFAVSQNGTLVFAPGALSHTLARVDRDGRRKALSDDRRGFRFPRISPDGRRVAVTIDPRPSEIWVYDIARQSRVRLTTDGHSIVPVWTPDGQWIDFSSRADIFRIPADGSGAAKPLLVRERQQWAKHWSRDGRFLLFDDVELQTGLDIWVMPISGEPRLLVGSPANETNGRVSPDGRWLAYSSDESGRAEIHVRPFPDVDDGKWVVSTTGGHTPVWSPDGRELYYMSRSAMMAVPVETRGAEFVPGSPVVLFDGPFDTTQDLNYDVAPDGAFFVMIETERDARPTRIQVAVNWAEELKRLAPVDR